MKNLNELDNNQMSLQELHDMLVKSDADMKKFIKSLPQQYFDNISDPDDVRLTRKVRGS